MVNQIKRHSVGTGCPSSLWRKSAYINLFHFAYIKTSEKYKSLYEKCSKYALIAINAK